jgi:hypothetical protein
VIVKFLKPDIRHVIKVPYQTRLMDMSFALESKNSCPAANFHFLLMSYTYWLLLNVKHEPSLLYMQWLNNNAETVIFEQQHSNPIPFMQ